MGRHRPQANLIHVKRSWDRQAGFVAPKSRSGNRRVPITDTLRRELLNHRLQQGNGGQGFVFPNKRGNKPFNPGTLNLHTQQGLDAAGLTPIGLHECRHSYAAYMIAAGINSKALSTYMGHASITITLDRYGHLLPGNEQKPPTSSTPGSRTPPPRTEPHHPRAPGVSRRDRKRSTLPTEAPDVSPVRMRMGRTIRLCTRKGGLARHGGDCQILCVSGCGCH